MVAISIGDLARTLLLQQSAGQTKSRLNSLTAQLASERKSDLAAALGGSFTELAGLTAGLRHLEVWGKTAGLQAARAGAMQAAIGRIHAQAQELSTDLLLVGETTTTAQDRILATDARQVFNSIISHLNLSQGEESLFSGQSSDRPALADPEVLLTALRNEVAGLTTAADIQAAVLDWFERPTGYAAVAYQGGDPRSPLRVSATEHSTLSITARDPAFRGTLSGVVLAVLGGDLIDDGFDAVGKQLLTAGAGQLINSGTSRNTLAAGLGLEQQRLDQLQTRHSAELTALKIRNSELVSADPYETASALETARAQLDLLFTLTARLSDLSLAKVLR